MVRHVINTLVLLVTFTVAGTLNAGIYKSYDTDGNVVFTDVPAENAEKVDLPDITTFKSQPYKPIQSSQPASGNKEVRYDLRLVQPANKETVRDNSGNVPVEIEVKPALRRELGHHMLLWLDNQKPIKFTSNRYQLSNIDRGTHTVSVKVVDDEGKALSTTQTNTVYVKRHSVNFNARPTPRSGGR